MPRDPAIDAAVFYAQAGKICREAEFIIQSFPNAEMHAVKRSNRLLDGVWAILRDLDDAYIEPETNRAMLECVESLITKLCEFETAPPPPPNAGVERLRTGRPGQPRYIIDLDEVLFQRGIGAKFKDIAKAMGVSTKTLRNHLQEAGIIATRIPMSVISDEALDEVVSGFIANHPFSGVIIAKGFLDSIGIRVPKERVNESMRRIDPIGILIRFDFYFIMV